FGNGLVADPPRPRLANVVPGLAAFQHRQDLPDHDARAFVSRLAVANGGISYNEPSELNSLAFSVRFHSVPFNHPPNPLGLQAATRNQSLKMLNCATRHDRTNMRTYKP